MDTAAAALLARRSGYRAADADSEHDRLLREAREKA
jgi:hypothetical protein